MSFNKIKEWVKRWIFWKQISRSNVYQRIRFPEKHKQQQEEPLFYKHFLKMHASRNMLIFDVGANRGLKSVIFSKLSKKVISFEPSGKLFLFLKERFKKNTNVKVFNCALGSNPAETDLFIVEDNEAYNSLNKKHFKTTTALRGIATMDTVKRQKIKVETLESFIGLYGVPKFIKIDVEGYEYEVLKGLKTAVPLLSFEANLPEFCQETVQSIEYLQSLAPDGYKYNFSTNHSFLLESFVQKDEAVAFITDTNLNYLEIFAVRA